MQQVERQGLTAKPPFNNRLGERRVLNKAVVRNPREFVKSMKIQRKYFKKRPPTECCATKKRAGKAHIEPNGKPKHNNCKQNKHSVAKEEGNPCRHHPPQILHSIKLARRGVTAKGV
jgi:hypothetical protein